MPGLDPITKKMQTLDLDMIDAITTIIKFDNELTEMERSLRKFIDEADVLIDKVNLLIQCDAFINSMDAVNSCKIRIPSEVERNQIKSNVIEDVKKYIFNFKAELEKYFLSEYKCSQIYEEIAQLHLPTIDKYMKQDKCGELSFKALCGNIGIADDDIIIIEEIKLLNEKYRVYQRSKNSFSYFTPIPVVSTSTVEVEDDNSLYYPYLIDEADDFEDAAEPQEYAQLKDKECFCIKCILNFLKIPRNRAQLQKYVLYTGMLQRYRVHNRVRVQQQIRH